MTRQWKNKAGYLIRLTEGATRSRVEVQASDGSSLLYHEYEYWQHDRALREAEALVALSRARAA
jgi:hypothetical protein